jgi:hypothetical protein
MQWLGKTRKLLHPSGVELTTPLLIPSFSSRGFSARKGVFSVRELLELTAPELTDCVLLSAYDLSKRNRLPSLEKFPLNVKVTFLDSGGYETGGEPDMSAIYGDSVRDPNWNETRLTKVYDRWPKSKPAVLVSFDHVDKRKRLHAQIESALKLFSRYPGQLTCFLIKPEQKKDFYLEGALHALLKNPKDVQKFSIIGVTEKELGVSFLDRMKKIVELRLGLDEAGLVCPIHVFGSLDPISTCLYFLSGAELFDGLTWLRYAYLDGACVYRHNFCALQYDLEANGETFIAKLLAHNLSALRRLEGDLRLAAIEKNVQCFAEPRRTLLNDSFNRLRGLMGGKI